MAHSKVETKTYFGQCKCCLNYAYLKNMWDPKGNAYKSDEIYGKMLVDCFAISWTVEDKLEDDRICELCIAKLNEALNFKNMVLKSQAELLDRDNDVKHDKSFQYKDEIENEDDGDVEKEYKDVQFLDEEMMEDDKHEDSPCREDSDDADNMQDTPREAKKRQKPKKQPKSGPKSVKPTSQKYTEDTLNEAVEAVRSKQMSKRQASHEYNVPERHISKTLKEKVTVKDGKSFEYEVEVVKEDGGDYEKDYKEVQFLDEEMMEEDDQDSDDVDEPQENPTKVRKRDWPKRPPRSEKYKSYRQYTMETLNYAVEAVRANKMTIRQSSLKYDVPRIQISKMLKGQVSENSIDNCKEMDQYFKEVTAIFKHTNATPFRSKGNTFFCFFCKKSETFRDPEELRAHTHNAHPNKHENLELIMRPLNNYETVRLDVENLTCNCETKGTWLEMCEHLKTHDIILEESKKRVVPYNLEINGMKCVLCDYQSCYTLLDAHMNSHFKNYICGECGDTFLTSRRLSKHKSTHKVGVYPCEYCNKMFAREVYRKKHTDFVHRNKSVFICSFCDERFVSDRAKRAHIEESHKNLVQKYFTCFVCGKNILSHHYDKHLRRCSSAINLEFKCDVCDKKFSTKNHLEQHKLRHTGVKNYQCDVCHNSYYSETAVKMHKKYKHNEIMRMIDARKVIK